MGQWRGGQVTASQHLPLLGSESGRGFNQLTQAAVEIALLQLLGVLVVVSEEIEPGGVSTAGIGAAPLPGVVMQGAGVRRPGGSAEIAQLAGLEVGRFFNLGVGWWAVQFSAQASASAGDTPQSLADGGGKPEGAALRGDSDLAALLRPPHRIAGEAKAIGRLKAAYGLQQPFGGGLDEILHRHTAIVEAAGDVVREAKVAEEEAILRSPAPSLHCSRGLVRAVRMILPGANLAPQLDFLVGAQQGVAGGGATEKVGGHRCVSKAL